MERIGDDEAGFSVDFDTGKSAVRVQGWGFWNAEVASSFGKKVGEACMSRPRGTVLVMDFANLKPMREEGQRSFGALIGSLPTLRLARVFVATSSHLTKLQLLRIVGEREAKGVVQFIPVGAEAPPAG